MEKAWKKSMLCGKSKEKIHASFKIISLYNFVEKSTEKTLLYKIIYYKPSMLLWKKHGIFP